MGEASAASRPALAVARLLEAGARTAFGLGLAAVGVMLVRGIEPAAVPAAIPGPGEWIASLLALEPEALVWLAVALTILLPAASVLAAAIVYWRGGERRAALTALLVLACLTAAVLVAAGTR